MSARRVVVLRHGRTAWNVEHRFQGRDHPADPPLDDVGTAQADAAAGPLTALGPALLVCSDSRRTRQTVAPLARATGLTPVFEPRLREQSLGRWEGLTRAEVETRFPAEFDAWRHGEDPDRVGGETRAEVGDRACAVVAGLPDVELCVLVTHSATAGALLARMVGLPVFPRRLGSLGNCHWSELVATGSGWSLRAHNTAPPA